MNSQIEYQRNDNAEDVQVQEHGGHALDEVSEVYA